MQAFQTITAKVVPVRIKDVDTDMIIPAEFLRSTSRDGYGKNLFKRLREQDPAFPLNQDRYADAKILVADSNFGCGSSREHAVWAIVGAGLRVVIAPSFSDIFAGNSGKNGLVLVSLPREVVVSFLDRAAAGDFELTVDLEKQTVVEPDGTTHSFDYDSFSKECILNGMDDLAYMLQHEDEIRAYKAERDQVLFYNTLQPNNV